nr:envelope glycoprotein L [Elephant endotheliotropic herpesvirus 1B]AID07168.1 envelope glycoprotein L [Elephant endotheliotropic herpesvirus 1B]AID07307.2 envelope glycoprotein L [Elephant endotheliotropic herpesvirus 1B]AIH00854.1 envelope glycoprotein L [Elephant endotheliotropic herpesvirus 1B]AIH00864.1 envelope glycoprotein L [Elephant endotheliotropic herpesvirus 1B]
MYDLQYSILKMATTSISTIVTGISLPGVCVTISINMLTLLNVLVTLKNNKVYAVSPHLSSRCYNNTLTCLNGGNVSFGDIPDYPSNYSKLIRYNSSSTIKVPMKYPLDEKLYNVLPLFYKNEDDLRVFLSLKKDSNGTWERNLIGVPDLKTVQEEERQYVFCDNAYAIFYCSQYTKNCNNNINLNKISYSNSIFTEHVLEIVFHGKPELRVDVKILLYNKVTLAHRIVTIPLFTPALLDVTFNIIYRILYRDPASHALLKTFKKFFDQHIGEPYRGPRNNRFVRVWQKDGFERMGNAIL